MRRKKNILKWSAKQRRGRSSAYPWSCTTPVAEFPCPEPQLCDCFPKVFLPSVVLFAVCGEKEIQGFAILCIVALTHSCQLHISCAVLSQALEATAWWHYQAALTTAELELSCTPRVPGKQPCASSPPLTLPFSFQLHCDAIPGSSVKTEIPCSLQCWYNTVFFLPTSHTLLVKPWNVLLGDSELFASGMEQPFQSLL